MSKTISLATGGIRGTVERARSRFGAAVALGLALALLALAALALAAPSAEARQFNTTLRGKVTDADGNPLSGVTVTVRAMIQDPSRVREPIELETDDEGQYYARNVPTGDSRIVFEMEGYETIEEERRLRPGPLRIDVSMSVVEVRAEVVRANVANDAYGVGVDAFNAGNYAEAVTQMHAALEALEDTADNAEARSFVYALMGAAYLRQRMFDEAVEAYRTRLGYRPEDAAAHLELAQALSESGDGAAAATHYQAALDLDPADAMTHYNVGVTMVDSGDVAGGIARLEMAIQLQPVYPLAHKNIAYAYAQTEQYEKAIAAFETYLEQSPDAEDAAQVRDFIAALKEMIG